MDNKNDWEELEQWSAQREEEQKNRLENTQRNFKKIKKLIK